MAGFRYDAVDDRGRSHKGRLDADNVHHARQLLRARGLLPIRVQETRARNGTDWPVRRMSDAEVGWVARQLASLLAAGLPLDESLRAAQEQAERAHVARVLGKVLDDVRAGHRLGRALAAHPRDFPALCCALVDAGEQSGELARVLERLASYIETRGALRNTVLTALIYPAIVLVVSTAIVIFLLSHVVPQVVGAFAQAHQTLPLLTRAMLFLGDAIQAWGGIAFAGLLLAVVLWRLHLRRPAARLAWHGRLLRLPVLGRYLRGTDVTRFAATLAILVDSRVALLAALEGARQTLDNLRLQTAVAQAGARVREGSTLALALREQGVFPPLLIQLVASGERTGALAAMLQHAAGVMAGELERRALRLTAVLEPFMILVMGGVVLLIVLAVMLPIIEINQMVF